MSIETFKGIKPKISKSAFVHESAVIIGDVSIGDNSSIWPNCVIRGDVQKVIIGDRTNVQDGSILHVTSDTKYCEGGIPLNIGNNVTIGHKVILHGCSIDSNTLIGMGSIILDNTIINEMAFIAAGAVVTPGTEVKKNELWAGNPAKFLRKTNENEKKLLINTPKVYGELRKEFLKKN